MNLPQVPATADGFVELFDQGGDDVPGNLVTVPIVFGEHRVRGHFGFGLRSVVAGETPSGIAQEAYGDASTYLRIFQTNRNQLADRNRILPGQQLRIPQSNQL